MKKKTVEERFWEKVDVRWLDDCWEWMASFDTNGYGAFGISKGKKVNSHRVAYELSFGDIPDGMLVCHKCDNRKCCNPNHLFLGTYLDNNRDSVDKGRNATGDRHGVWVHRNEMLESKKRHSKYFNAPEGMNWCSGCKKYKPVSEFNKSKYEITGLKNECKSCRKEGRKRHGV